MKKFLYSIGVVTLAFALTAQGEEIKTKGKARTEGGITTRSASVKTSGVVRSQPSVSKVATYNRNYVDRSHAVTPRTNTVNANVARTYTRVPRTATVNTNANVRTFRDRNVATNASVTSRNNVTVNRERNFRANRERNVAVNRDRNFRANERIAASNNVTVNRTNRTFVNRNRNVTVTNNWRGTRFSGASYTAFRNYHRTYHDRGWWRNHYDRIVFVSGGWYYWNAGYWFPAWGYDSYAYYPYDGPIYGYNGMAPDQVIVDVQTQLQRDGYYAGPIDGALGPMTRAAIASFQADHGLAITSAIDEPTLDSLGIS
jgi:hypothetical protein